MKKELLAHAAKLFDTPEKWYAYLEMLNHKEDIKSLYFSRVKDLLLKYFIENPVDKWACEPWGDPKFDMKWYLTDFGKDSLALSIGWRFEFHLRLENIISFDTNKMDILLKTEYSELLTAFDRIDRQFEVNAKAKELRNYYFESPYDGNFDGDHVDQLAWFAGNQTESLVNQIIRKVERFRKDEKLTKMLYDLNKECKIVVG